MAGWARALTLVSEEEANLFERCCGVGPIHAITNGVDLERFQPREIAIESGCVFVGALDYPPNVEGICWFCREVWPEVRRLQPDATIALVGRRPTAQVRRLDETAGVVVVGDVSDVRPHLAGAAVVIAPLKIARGVQNKVLEAFAMGKAVVATPQALTGLGVEPGRHALMAETPDQWAMVVARLLDDRSLRARLGSSGRAYVESYHRWDECLSPFATLLDLPSAEAESREPGRLRVGGKAR